MKRYGLFFFVALVVFCWSPVWGSDVRPSVVSAEWLSQRMNESDTVILDIRKVEDYKQGHIPGALSLTYAAWRTVDNNLGCQLPHREELSDTICGSGINAGTFVVIVGNTDTERQRMNATRVAWTLKYAGVKQLAILDGGFKKWAAGKYPVTTDWVKRPRSKYKCQWNENVVTTKRYLQSHLKDVAIVDTRPERLYRGEISDPMLKRKGHIPGAVNLPYHLVFTKDGTFDDREKLTSLASRAVGTEKGREIVVLCCDGQFASSWWFVLSEMLRYRDVKIYDGSMEEWCGDRNTPLVEEKGEKR